MEENIEQQKPVWSGSFWREKIIRTLIAALLLVVLVMLWNWDSSTEITTNNETAETPVATDTAAEPATDPVVEEPLYTLELPDSASAAVQSTDNGNNVETYTMADGATVTVYPNGGLTAPTDITWQYTVDADGTADVVERIDSLCTVGATGCSAENGQLELTVAPQDASDTSVVIYIVDSNIATKTVTQMTAQYEDIVNTLKVRQ